MFASTAMVEERSMATVILGTNGYKSSPIPPTILVDHMPSLSTASQIQRSEALGSYAARCGMLIFDSSPKMLN